MLDIIRELSIKSFQHWIDYEVLTWRWYLKILIIISMIIVWVKYVDKKRIFEIVMYSLLLSLISTILDVIGTDLAFWEYPVRVLPLQFSEIHDLIVIPIVYSLVYQYFPKWKAFAIANLVLAALSAFVFERIFIMLNFYKPVVWKHIYSFPIFFAMAVFSKYLIEKMKRIQLKVAQNTPNE